MIVQLYSIKSPEEALKVIELGCDYLGVSPVSGANLPNELSYDEIKEIFATIKGKGNGVLISIDDPEDLVVERVRELKPDVIHMCGGEVFSTPELAKRIKEANPTTRLEQAVGVSGPESIEEAKMYAEWCDILILDSVTENIPGVGAAGVPHDWNIDAEIVKAVAGKADVILAGGLTPENVAEAVRVVKPWGVDSLTHTNKFLPDGTRIKDLEKVEKFCREARSVKF